jgi:hypothetical protein
MVDAELGMVSALEQTLHAADRGEFVELLVELLEGEHGVRPLHSPAPVPVLTVHGAAYATANCWQHDEKWRDKLQAKYRSINLEAESEAAKANAQEMMRRFREQQEAECSFVEKAYDATARCALFAGPLALSSLPETSEALLTRPPQATLGDHCVLDRATTFDVSGKLTIDVARPLVCEDDKSSFLFRPGSEVEFKGMTSQTELTSARVTNRTSVRKTTAQIAIFNSRRRVYRMGVCFFNSDRLLAQKLRCAPEKIRPRV